MGVSFVTAGFLGFGELAGLVAGAFAEVELRLRARLTFLGLQADVGAIGLELARFHVVVQEARQDFVHDLVAQGRIFDRKGDLDAADEISRHPISAREINIRVAVVREIIDPAVLEETADDTDDANVFAQARNLGPQTTNAADDQIDLHPGAGSFIELLDDLLIDERIEFHDDARRSRPATAWSRSRSIKPISRLLRSNGATSNFSRPG